MTDLCDKIVSDDMDRCNDPAECSFVRIEPEEFAFAYKLSGSALRMCSVHAPEYRSNSAFREMTLEETAIWEVMQQ